MTNDDRRIIKIPRGYAPVRLDKVEEAKKILKIIDEGDRQSTKYKRPSVNKKLLDLFIDGRESLEKGLSIRELVLILHPDRATAIQMLATPKNDEHTYWWVVWPLLKQMRIEISKFRNWKGNKKVALYPRQTPTGKWLYYRILDLEELKEVEVRLAKGILTQQKYLERAGDFLELPLEERERIAQEFEDKIRAEIKQRAENRAKKEAREKKRGMLQK